MPQRLVLVTGAAGYIARQVLPALRERYALRLVDARAEDSEGRPVEGVEVMDLLAAERPELERLWDGVDTVIHLGYVRPPEGADVQARYDAERLNVDLMQRVYQLSVDCIVRRVVAASTNQAAKWYEGPWREGRRDRVESEDYPRAESLYGWAKAAYEALGFTYASGGLGRALEVVHLRIVVPREVRAADFAGRPPRDFFRDITGYISPRDLSQLVVKSVDAESIEDEHGVPFRVFYGVSNNARTFWSITNAREAIGYAPEDDSEVRFRDEIATITRESDDSS